MRRRKLLAVAGLAAGGSVSRANAQAKTPVVGFINGTSAAGYARPLAAFQQSLAAAGYVDGRTVAIEYRWAEGHYDRLEALVADLVGRKVDVLAATSTPANIVAKKGAGTVPVVFTTSSDPVQLGLVASLNRPGANVTGVTTLNVELGPKRLELLQELAPTATVVAHLVNPANPNVKASTDVKEAAQRMGKQLLVVNASTDDELGEAFEQIAAQRGGALLVNTDAFFFSRRERLAALATRYKLPAIYDRREFAIAGGLLAYGGSATAAYRLAGDYVARILKGEKPAELPVQQATAVELVVNLKAAAALGLTVPPSLLARADDALE